MCAAWAARERDRAWEVLWKVTEYAHHCLVDPSHFHRRWCIRWARAPLPPSGAPPHGAGEQIAAVRLFRQLLVAAQAAAPSAAQWRIRAIMALARKGPCSAVTVQVAAKAVLPRAHLLDAALLPIFALLALCAAVLARTQHVFWVVTALASGSPSCALHGLVFAAANMLWQAGELWQPVRWCRRQHWHQEDEHERYEASRHPALY